jgi:hypothetical protein
VSCAHPAVTNGRYHRSGGNGVWYASDQEQAAWSELFRHFTDAGVDPFEVRRRTGRARVEMDVLDLTSGAVRADLGIDESDLLGDDYSISREIAVAAEAAGFDGILAPSVALRDRRTLVVFHHALAKVTTERSVIRQPPPRLADLLDLVRLHPDVPFSMRARLRAVAAAGSDAIRRLRRRR